jgi:hypothetical protein
MRKNDTAAENQRSAAPVSLLYMAANFNLGWVDARNPAGKNLVDFPSK